MHIIEEAGKRERGRRVDAFVQSTDKNLMVPVLIFVYICLHLFTFVYICLHLFTFVYICLHLFTFVYNTFQHLSLENI
jgi:hypothetical protein